MKVKDSILNFKNWMVFIGAIAVASVCSFLLMSFTKSDFHVPMIFVLAVLVISMYSIPEKAVSILNEYLPIGNRY